jgi:CubicO group peptidase (beta-lactamase class C family)
VQAYHALTSGYVLGEIIQRITGGTLREYLAATIQQPLGFRHGNYGVPEKRLAEVARNYMTGPAPPFFIDALAKRALGVKFQEAVDISNETQFLSAVIPSGNIMASADEYCRFFQMLLNGGELDGRRLFKPGTVRRAIMPRGQRQFDRILILPLRYSAGMLLGNEPLGLYGPGCGQAYGHPGFINMLGWADPRRALSVALLTNGKAALTPHLLPFGQLLWRIARHCPPIPGRTTAQTIASKEVEEDA